jgi:hypothetical protein
VLQSVCFGIVNDIPWHGSNSQMHKDLDVPFFPATSGN